MESADEKRFGVHGDGNAPAIAVGETKMTPLFMDHRKTQLAQGSHRVFWIHFLARHGIYAGTATRAVVINSARDCSSGNDRRSLWSDSR